MSEVKVTELTEDIAPTADDLIMTINAPGTVPANRKVTITNLGTVIGSLLVSDTAFAASWDGVTTVAPSKNAVYDEMILKATLASPKFTGSIAIGALSDFSYFFPEVDGVAVGLRNGTTAQTLRIYTSYISAISYERCVINCVPGTITIGAETANAGSDNISLDLQTAGTGTVQVNGTPLGTGAYATIANYATLASPNFTTQISLDTDLILTREAAATLQLGVDAAGVTNQMIKAPDRITSDGVGADLTIAAGRNRGASAGGSIIFQTSPAAGAGVTGTLATALTIDSTKTATFTGQVLVPAGTAGNPSIGLTGEVNTGFWFPASARARITLGGNECFDFRYGILTITGDLCLQYEAGDILALRRAANAQKLRIYTSYTDASNYERFAINTAAGTITLAAETLGTGTDNIDIVLTPAGTGAVKTSKLSVNTNEIVSSFGMNVGAGYGVNYSSYNHLSFSTNFTRLGNVKDVQIYIDSDNSAADAEFLIATNAREPGGTETRLFSFTEAGSLLSYTGNGAYGAIMNKMELVTTTAAATAVTAADFIPDGAIPIAISTYVETAITVASLTGYNVGDGVDPDRWGAITGHAVGTYSNNANWTATTVQAFTAAQAITLTSVGADFPAGGKIRVCMTYLSGSQPTS